MTIRSRFVTGMCEDRAFLVKREQRVGSAGVLARNNVSCKRLMRRMLIRVYF